VTKYCCSAARPSIDCGASPSPTVGCPYDPCAGQAQATSQVERHRGDELSRIHVISTLFGLAKARRDTANVVIIQMRRDRTYRGMCSPCSLQLNYGGGIKFLNLAGPLGFRVDVRGRTLPNFFGENTTWLEPTAGITFSWGER
jgi:hypothetical protein